MLVIASGIALGVVFMTVITAIVFLVIVAWAEETWLDAGFYGSLFGGGLTALFLILAEREYRIEQE